MGNTNEREKFASRLGFILASAGCAVGLGNVWKFPYICGQNGGAAFILIYLVCLLILGLPILICEFAIGRGSGLSMGAALEKLAQGGKRWKHYKWFAFAGNYLLMMFYTMVAGWMIFYAVKSAFGVFGSLSVDEIAGEFDDMLASPLVMTLFTLIVVIISIGVCSLGLQNGVERITKIMMILLIILMLAMAVHSIFLKGSAKGLEFYLVPDFNKLVERGIGNVVFDAMTHAFFTLSVGIGSMAIFGSYLSKDRRLTGEAINVVVLDTFIALTAGIIIIPSCFAYGVSPDSGPPLLFITLPNVFNHMPGGRIWGLMFFVFMSFAALSTVIAVYENIISISMDMFGWSRKKACLINMFGIAILSLPAVFGYNILSFVKPLGANTNIMDLEDFLVSYNILPLGSLLFVLFCTKKNGWGFENFVNEVDQGKGMPFPKWIRLYMKYVLPLIILVIYFKGYYGFFENKGLVTLIIWMVISVLLVAYVFWLTIGKRKSDN